jgi:hypothetical protein
MKHPNYYQHEMPMMKQLKSPKKECLYQQDGNVNKAHKKIYIKKHFKMLALNAILYRRTQSPIFLNVYGAQESIPRNEFHQLM